MKNLSIILVAGLAFMGCKKKGGADCDKAIDNGMALSKDDMSKAPGMDDKMMAKMRDVGLQHCKDDKWSAEATKCMADAKTKAEAQGCYGKLTDDQRTKMNTAAMEMAKPVEAPTAAAPAAGGDMAGSAAAAPAAAPAAGEATGSAAAAPAAGSAAEAK